MKISLSLKVAIGIFFIAGAGVFLISMLSFSQMKGYVKGNILKSSQLELNENAKVLKKDIAGMIKDVKLLTNNEHIEAIYRAMETGYDYSIQSSETLSALKVKLGKTFKFILEQNSAYFNIRLIHKSGQELVVSLKDKNGEIIVQAEEGLQNKANRPYFQEAIALDREDLYISRINLNKEHGTFSVPHIPTIRVALPIYIEDKIFAILIINANIDKLFSLIALNTNTNKHIFLANQEGYYIYNEDRAKTFGFDLGSDYKISDAFDLQREAYFHDGSLFSHKIFFIDRDRYLILGMIMSDRFLKEQSSELEKKFGIYIFITTLLIALFSLLLTHYFVSPILKLTQQAKEISSGDAAKSTDFDTIYRNDEIGELSRSLKTMLERIENSKKEIEQKVKDRTKELHGLNENLEHIVKVKTSENIKQLELMQQQNKMASMGEMIGAIAHQWRQPLNEVSIAIQNLKYDYEDGLIDRKFLENFIEKSKEIIKFMSSTIDDFRNFYRVDKEKELFRAKKAIEKTLSMQMAQLVNNNITIYISGEDFKIDGFRNEFMQVVLNIINNAKDVLIENEIEYGRITIELENRVVCIRDNAGGIPDEVIHRVFEPYFTTKEQGKGTGMGLYMSKMIIEENMQAKMSVSNGEDGAEFRMDFNV